MSSSGFRFPVSEFPFLISVVLLVACADPDETRFVSLCVEAGDTPARCHCTFEMLESELDRDLDDEFVSFLADFANWSVPPGGRSLEREELMAKYDLSEADFRYLTQVVGGTLINAFNSCGEGPERSPLSDPASQAPQ